MLILDAICYQPRDPQLNFRCPIPRVPFACQLDIRDQMCSILLSPGRETRMVRDRTGFAQIGPESLLIRQSLETTSSQLPHLCPENHIRPIGSLRGPTHSIEVPRRT